MLCEQDQVAIGAYSDNQALVWNWLTECSFGDGSYNWVPKDLYFRSISGNSDSDVSNQHELGHGMRLSHAMYGTIEYGDQTATMGSVSNFKILSQYRNNQFVTRLFSSSGLQHWYPQCAPYGSAWLVEQHAAHSYRKADCEDHVLSRRTRTWWSVRKDPTFLSSRFLWHSLYLFTFSRPLVLSIGDHPFGLDDYAGFWYVSYRQAYGTYEKVPATSGFAGLQIHKWAAAAKTLLVKVLRTAGATIQLKIPQGGYANVTLVSFNSYERCKEQRNLLLTLIRQDYCESFCCVCWLRYLHCWSRCDMRLGFGSRLLDSYFLWRLSAERLCLQRAAQMR